MEKSPTPKGIWTQDLWTMRCVLYNCCLTTIINLSKNCHDFFRQWLVRWHLRHFDPKITQTWCFEGMFLIWETICHLLWALLYLNASVQSLTIETWFFGMSVFLFLWASLFFGDARNCNFAWDCPVRFKPISNKQLCSLTEAHRLHLSGRHLILSSF